MYYVYLLNSDNHFYVGFSDDLKRRLREHNAGNNIATKAYVPWKLIFYEAYTEKHDAVRREKYLKTTSGRQALRWMLRVYREKNLYRHEDYV